ncbi:MAG: hypothetical protein P3A28_10115, partial [Gemmatimonadota bacterium]|nr:hypothetical protein [Gemmatimonadota bacterium]
MDCRTVALLLVAASSVGGAQISGMPTGAERITGGRFTLVAMPSDVGLARNLLAESIARDTFPGLPRPMRRAEIFIAPDERRFREWMGEGVPEWGAAVAYPDHHRIVMQGRGADSRAGGSRAGSTRATRRTPRASGGAMRSWRRALSWHCAACHIWPRSTR